MLPLMHEAVGFHTKSHKKTLISSTLLCRSWNTNTGTRERKRESHRKEDDGLLWSWREIYEGCGETEWLEEKERTFGDEKADRLRCRVEKGTKGMERRERVSKERENKGKSGPSYVVWEVQQQPTPFTFEMLNVSFCRALWMFLVFPLYALQRRLQEKMLKKGSWIKGPEQNFKPSTSKVNDMHLSAESPNKAFREWFHKRWFVLGKIR